MLIKRITISNLFSYGPEPQTIDMEPLTVLVGANNSGKTNLFKSLRLLLHPPRWPKHAPITLHRYRQQDQPAPYGELTVHIPKQPDTSGDLQHKLQVGDTEYLTETLSDFGRSTRAPAHAEDPTKTLQLLNNSKWADDASALKAHYQSILLHFSHLHTWSLVSETDQLVGHFDPDQLLRFTTFLNLLDNNISKVVIDRRDSHAQPVYLDNKREPVDPHQLSDSTKRIMTLVARIINAPVHSIMLIEEPDLGLHPDLMRHLYRLLTTAAKTTQIIITTHSTTLLDNFHDRIQAIIALDRHTGPTTISNTPANLMENMGIDRGELTLGQMWTIGHIGGTRF